MAKFSSGEKSASYSAMNSSPFIRLTALKKSVIVPAISKTITLSGAKLLGSSRSSITSWSDSPNGLHCRADAEPGGRRDQRHGRRAGRSSRLTAACPRSSSTPSRCSAITRKCSRTRAAICSRRWTFPPPSRSQ